MQISFSRALGIALITLAAISLVSLLAAALGFAILAKPIPNAVELILLYLLEHLPGLIVTLVAMVIVIRRGVRVGLWWAVFGVSLLINPLLWLAAGPILPGTISSGGYVLPPPSEPYMLLWGIFTAVISRHVAHRLLQRLAPPWKSAP